MNSIARVYSQALGGALILIGVLGWVPPLNPGGALLGIFTVNTPHNLAHILTGALGVGAGFGLSDRSVRVYTAMMSVIYGVLVIVGFAQITLLDQALALNLPDNLLHTAIFALSLLICIAAFWEFRSLSRLQRLAPALRRQRLAPAAGASANAGFGASSEIGPLSGASGAGAFGLRAPASHGLLGQRNAGATATATVASGVTDMGYMRLDSFEALQERLNRLERESLVTKDTLERQVEQLRHECELLRAQVQTLQAVLNAPGGGRPSSPHAAFYPTPYPSDIPSSPQMPYLGRQSQQSAPRPQQRPLYRPDADQWEASDGVAWDTNNADENDDQGQHSPWSNTP